MLQKETLDLKPKYLNSKRLCDLLRKTHVDHYLE